MKKRVFAMAMVAAMGMSLLAGCGGSSSSDTTSDSATEEAATEEETADASESSTAASGDYSIGFLPLGMANEYWINMCNGAQAFADENGFELVVQASSDQADAEAQLGYVENMIASQVDAICICPCSADGLVSAVKKCQDAGIVVINLDTQLNADLLESSGCTSVPFYGSDNYVIAQTAADFLMENFDEGTNVAILTGVEGQENALLRKQGFEDEADGYFNIVADQAADWDVEEGYTATQNMLNGNPEIEVIYACNDNMAIGALRACQEADRTDIKIIGVDAISEAVEYVQSGDLFATVAQQPIDMAQLGLQACLDVLNGTTAYEDLPLSTDTGCEVITSDKAADYLEYLSQYDTGAFSEGEATAS